MAKQTFTTGQVLTAAQMTSLQQTAMGGGAATAKTASYVLTAADAGTTVIMNAAGATTITVNTALFAAGDTVNIQNIGAGTCTVTAGTATVNTAGSLALAQYEGGILYFVSASVATYFDYYQASGSTIPLTTKGDVLGYDTALARVPIGTNNQVLTADSTQALGLKWATPSAPAYSGCWAYLTAASQAIVTATSTTLAFTSEIFDTDGYHDNATNTNRFTIPTGLGGKFLITANITYAGATAGRRLIYLNKNAVTATATLGTFDGVPSSVSNTYTYQFSTIATLAAADYFSISIFQSSGANVDVNGGDPLGGTGTTWIQLTRLGS